jgi:membrane protease YdiL (CAAX protease family)
VALHHRRPSARALIAALAAAPLAAAASVAIGGLQEQFLPPADHSLFERKLRAVETAVGPTLLVLCVTVVPAVCEELLFRGLLLAGLRRSLGDAGAVLASAFCFAALHLSPERFLAQFAVGILLGMLVVRSGSLWPAVVLHGLHNLGVIALSTAIQNGPVAKPGLLPPPALWLAVAAGLAGAATAVWSARRCGADHQRGC